MHKLSHSIALLLAAVLLAGCASKRSERAGLYDLGPLHTPSAVALPALTPISVAPVTAPGWLDTTLMFYRLNYENQMQPRPYAQARWTMSPSQLLLTHLKSRIAQAGGVALASSQGAANVPVLRIEADDFIQMFDAPDASNGRVGLRASVYRGRVLLAHKTFMRQAPAPTPDAAGGARALSVASDAAIGDMIVWLGTLDLK